LEHAVAALSALVILAGLGSLAAETNTSKATVIVLVGAPGEEDFGKVVRRMPPRIGKRPRAPPAPIS